MQNRFVRKEYNILSAVDDTNNVEISRPGVAKVVLYLTTDIDRDAVNLFTEKLFD